MYISLHEVDLTLIGRVAVIQICHLKLNNDVEHDYINLFLCCRKPLDEYTC